MHNNIIDMNLSKLQEMVKYREVYHATVHRIVKSQTWLRTEQQKLIVETDKLLYYCDYVTIIYLILLYHN